MSRLFPLLFLGQILCPRSNLTLDSQKRNELTFNVSVPCAIHTGAEMVRIDQNQTAVQVTLQLESPTNSIDWEVLSLKPIESCTILTSAHCIVIQIAKLSNPEKHHCSELNVQAIMGLSEELSGNQGYYSYTLKLLDGTRARTVNAAENAQGHQDNRQQNTVLQFLKDAFPLKNNAEIEAASKFNRIS